MEAIQVILSKKIIEMGNAEEIAEAFDDCNYPDIAAGFLIRLLRSRTSEQWTSKIMANDLNVPRKELVQSIEDLWTLGLIEFKTGQAKGVCLANG